MDSRAAKLALARKKLKDHQEKKTVVTQDDDTEEPCFEDNTDVQNVPTTNKFLEEVYEDFNTQKPCLADINVTEILVSNKRNLQSKLSQFENDQARLVNDNTVLKQHLNTIELELKNVNEKYLLAVQDVASQNKNIEDLMAIKAKLLDENGGLQEQLELTKSMLTAKESESFSLHSQLHNLQNKLETTQLQLQQLTNGTKEHLTSGILNTDSEVTSEVLIQKISTLEQQVNKLQKDKEQMSIHYEHYVGELNEQLKSMVLKNEECALEIRILSNREKELIDQISEMEIRLQNFKIQKDSTKEQIQKDSTNNEEIIVSVKNNEMEQKYEMVQGQLLELNERYDELQKKYAESESKLVELQEEKDSKLINDSISFSKLQADITSDKIAVQRATEQNKKLKIDLQNLEEAFVKMSKDKLEFTEKLDAEKYLNRELTIRLADMEEKIKDLFMKLVAKDEEMIRLQSCLRDIETQYEKNPETNTWSRSVEDTDIIAINKVELTENLREPDCNVDDHISEDKLKIPKQDAMLKLQDRFLKIMGEVADLSDEKHRLEHIILQLQNETDTICEYVALYQQQRNLLKRRDEERSAQIKIFQAECELLKNQLEELSSILVRLTEDKELLTYFQTESRHKDVVNIMNLLKQLKSNTIVDPQKKCSELSNFYPCSCCSGQLINV